MTIKERAENLWASLGGGAGHDLRYEEIVAKIALAFIEERKIAFEDERARNLELIDRCRKMYESYHHRANVRDRGEDADFYPTVSAKESFDKMMACEYVTLVVKEWDLDMNTMPMPF